MTLIFDLCDLEKPLEKWPITRRSLLPSFIEIYPLRVEISGHVVSGTKPGFSEWGLLERPHRLRPEGPKEGVGFLGSAELTHKRTKGSLRAPSGKGAPSKSG